MDNNQQKIFTITEINRYISELLGRDYLLNNFTIKGEISNLRDIKYSKWKSKYMFFKLKDEESVIDAITFSDTVISAIQNKEVVEGNEIIANCSITGYWKNGRYSIKVNEILNTKIGLISQKIEALKQKFLKLGYFDQKHKQAIPEFPRNIAIITGNNSAALNDIKKTIDNRYSLLHNIYIFPCLVQGESAPASIVEAIKQTKEYDIDLLIISRGGGSIEDLAVFSDENVVIEIFNYKHAPIITGIGHEIDTSIADLVADHSAVTPTAAAEYVTRNSDEKILQFLEDSKKSLEKGVLNLFENCVQEIGYLSNNLESIIKNIIQENLTKFYLYKNKFQEISSLFLKNQEALLLKNKLKLKESLSKLLVSKSNKLEKISNELLTNWKNYFNNKVNELKHIKAVLEANDIQSNLKRGYSIVVSNNRTVKNASDLKIKQLINIKFYKGSSIAEVAEIEEENK